MGVYFGLDMKVAVNANMGSRVSSSRLERALIRPLLRPSSSNTATIYYGGRESNEISQYTKNK